MSILDHWSHPTSPPRPIQKLGLEWAEQQKAKYLIMEAPVGCGKSHIGMTLSRYLTPALGNSFILTPQRILQEQYENSFPLRALRTLYGKSNYVCNPKNTTCDVGSLVKPACKNCPQANARRAAIASSNVVFNYKIALLHFAFLSTFGPRSLMILDECHNTEEMLCEFDAIPISDWRCKRYGIRWKKCSTIPEAQKWVQDTYIPRLDDVLADMKEECEERIEEYKDRSVPPQLAKRIREFKSLSEHFDSVCEFNGMDTLEQYFVLVHDVHSFKFKRLKAAWSFKSILEPKADRFLFMSSTILNYKGYCMDLGIDPDEAAFISLQSEFEPKNRPVYFSPQAKMNAKWNTDENAQGRKRLLDTVVKLLGVHNVHSGIIHTGNFAIAVWLTKELPKLQKTHQIMHHNPDSGDDRNEVINAFTDAKKPTVLISPSITEGLDLYEDRSRFAIFCKTPYPYLGDQWIKARLNLSQEWYSRQALIQIIQGSGRIVRSKDDWGNTYILDISWGFLQSQTNHMIPQWWKNAYGRLE
ncbi:hypothetical protein LCGC14_1261980 [marine sediment metagenome]|uniref:ATP-dependent helicase C-terminal domain-containing protein n=1 Tax=marine sediment metagenome TaxID=412755 RepID=A0A0F9LLP1_9ZZZZ